MLFSFANNTPATAAVIRLICSPGLTQFSLCLLVHKHFNVMFGVTEATCIKLRHPKIFNTFLHTFFFMLSKVFYFLLV